MKFIEAYCKECRLSFKITFKTEQPPYNIFCPLCRTKAKITSIDKDDDDWGVRVKTSV